MIQPGPARGAVALPEAGMTLIELIIAIAIVGIAFAAILAGVGETASSSGFHRRQADVGAVVRSAAETIKATAYVPCTTANFPQQYRSTLPASSGQTLVSPPTLERVTKITDRTASLQGCASDTGLQLVEVKAVSTDGKASESVWVVKSNR